MTDAVTPPHVPPVLTGGPPALTVLIGNMPAWKGIPLAAGPGLMAASTSTEATLQALETTAKVAEAAALAGAATPAGPGLAATATAARLAAETAKASSLAANSASIAAAAATGASMHACTLPWPIPPHGPGVVIDGSPTVMIEHCPACRLGDTIIEAIGPPNKIVMGCMTVMIGDSGMGGSGMAGSQGGAARPVDSPAPAVPAETDVPTGCEFLKKGRLVSGTDAQFSQNRKASTVKKPGTAVKHTFPGDTKPQDATEYEVAVDGKTIKVIMPVAAPGEAGTHLPSVDEVAKGLGAVPTGQLATIKQVEVSPNRNPDDAHWATEYNTPGFRSAAVGGNGGVTMFPTPSQLAQSRIDSNLIHEGGHTYQSEIWKDANTKKAWADAIKKDPVSPSTYADSSIDEDMSESLVMYTLSKGTKCEETAKKMFPNRYAELDKLMKK